MKFNLSLKHKVIIACICVLIIGALTKPIWLLYGAFFLYFGLIVIKRVSPSAHKKLNDFVSEKLK